MILLDTNVLVYAANADAPQHADCRRVIDAAVAGRLPAVLFPQILMECFSVVTSPRRMPQPVSPRDAWTDLRWLSRTIEVRHAPETMLDDLERVLDRHPARARDIFDRAIVAQMVDHGIRTICTCNVDDFRMAGIQAVDPSQVLADSF